MSVAREQKRYDKAVDQLKSSRKMPLTKPTLQSREMTKEVIEEKFSGGPVSSTKGKILERPVVSLTSYSKFSHKGEYPKPSHLERITGTRFVQGIEGKTRTPFRTRIIQGTGSRVIFPIKSKITKERTGKPLERLEVNELVTPRLELELEKKAIGLRKELETLVATVEKEEEKKRKKISSSDELKEYMH